MVLNTGKLRINIDTVSFMLDDMMMIIVDGQGVNLNPIEYDAVKKAFDWHHDSYMYDENKTKIKGGK